MSDINIQQVRIPFSYEIIRESSIKQNEYSSAIAISKDNLLVLATSDKAIKVYQFRLGKLKQFQHLNMFRKDATAISLFEKSSLFITGSIDSTIRISSTTLFSSAKYIQQLYGHTSWISNLIIHPIDQDVLFSSSNDSQIRVWQKMQSWCCCQLIKEHKNDVKGLSISKKGNQLLSCSEDLQILIMEPVSSKNYLLWQIVQKINVDYQGYRICSIDDSIFTFQQDSQNQMQIYSKDENGLYRKTGCLDVAGGGQSCDFLFPSIYHSSKQLLIVKNGYVINIIRFCKEIPVNNQNTSQFLLEQVIDFGSNSYGHIWGTLSQDQEYLITWDCDSQEIQIRKFQEQ